MNGLKKGVNCTFVFYFGANPLTGDVPIGLGSPGLGKLTSSGAFYPIPIPFFGS